MLCEDIALFLVTFLYSLFNYNRPVNMEVLPESIRHINNPPKERERLYISSKKLTLFLKSTNKCVMLFVQNDIVNKNVAPLQVCVWGTTSMTSYTS